MVVQLEKDKIWFPKPHLAEDDGLLAIGGDLSPERLLLAYRNGIFPWFSDNTPILWYAPHERFVLYPSEIRISGSMKRVINSRKFKLTVNSNFEEVIKACATVQRQGQDGTWITSSMIDAYIQLHKLGHAHSVEVWQHKELVGGIYGVLINGVFCGESMFSRVSNASKLALITVAQSKGIRLIDCQVYTSHLESLGARMIKAEVFLNLLALSPEQQTN